MSSSRNTDQTLASTSPTPALSPDAFKPLRENFNKGTYLSDGIGLYSPDKIELPAEMSELKKAYLADAYTGKLKELTFLVFLAYTFDP